VKKRESRGGKKIREIDKHGERGGRKRKLNVDRQRKGQIEEERDLNVVSQLL